MDQLGDDERLELERLRKENARYEALIGSLPVGVIYVDEDDRVALANPMAEQIRCVGERVGAPLSECHPDRTHDRLDEVMRRFRYGSPEERHPIVMERMHRYEVTYARVDDLEDRYRGVVWVAQDILRRKELERELMHSERLAGLGRMAAKLAHDIKNPLNAIQGAAHYLQRELKEDEEELTVLIKEQVSRISDLVSRLRAITQPLQPSLEPSDLSQIVKAELRALEMSCTNLECRLELPAELPKIRCDQALIARFLNNAFQNACQAMQAYGELQVSVLVRTETDGEWVDVLIQDSGPGFPHRVLSSPFQPFVTTRSDGVGLGLTIMREICLLHGGTLEIANNDTGGLVRASLSTR